MKVVVVNTLYPPHIVGGAERSVSLLCEAMVRSGVEVVVISLHPEAVELTETLNGVRVYRLPLDNIYWGFDQKERPSLLRLQWHLRDVWNVKAGRRIGVILDREAPDIVHTNNLTGFSVTAWSQARARKLKIVHTLRDYSLLCRRATLFRDSRNCEKRCADCAAMTLPSRAMSHHVDGVIGNSQFMLDLHSSMGYFNGVPGRTIYNIMDAIDPASLPRAERNPQLTFGYIGKVDQDKGIEVVLEAATRIKRPDWKLKIAGRGTNQYVEGLKQRFPDPRIEWLGFVSTRDFMNQVDVIVISSIWYEPLPRTLIESIAYRRPSICSTSGGIPEISGYADLIGQYDPLDVGALAQLMELALADNRFADTYRIVKDVDLSSLFGAPVVAASNLAAYEAAMAGK